MLLRAYRWWLTHRYHPRREEILSADPEWLALAEADRRDRDRNDEAAFHGWLERTGRRNEIERLLVPDPWPKRMGDCLERLSLFQGVAAARARRRDDFAHVRRSWAGEKTWAAGTKPVAWTWGWVLFINRALHPDVDDGRDLTWREGQELLADANDPPRRCAAFAIGEVDEGCSPECTHRRKGPVRCLALQRSRT